MTRRPRLQSALLTAATLLVCLAPNRAAGAEHSAEVGQWLNEADAAIDAGHFEEALTLAKKAEIKEPDAEDVHNTIGLCYSHMRRNGEAAAEFRKALKIKPDYLPALHNLASELYSDGLYADAISCLQKELELRGGNDAETLTSLADIYRDRAYIVGGPQRDADFDAAYNDYRKAMNIDPSLATLRNHLAVYYFFRNELDKAEQEIRKSIDLKHDYAAAYYNLALVETKRHRLPEAAQAFRDSLRYETVPEYKEQVRRKMAQLGLAMDGSDFMSHSYDLLGQNRFAEAAQVLQQAVAGPGANNAVAWNNLGYALARQGLNRDAIRCYKRACALLPNRFPSAQYNLGQSLRMVGDLDGAQRALKQALNEAGGMNALAHNALGLVYKQKKQMEMAKAEYRLAIMQSGDTLPVVHFNLALVLEREPNQHSEAISEYQRYLEQAPDGANAAAARAHLDALGRNS